MSAAYREREQEIVPEDDGSLVVVRRVVGDGAVAEPRNGVSSWLSMVLAIVIAGAAGAGAVVYYLAHPPGESKLPSE